MSYEILQCQRMSENKRAWWTQHTVERVGCWGKQGQLIYGNQGESRKQ